MKKLFNLLMVAALATLVFTAIGCDKAEDTFESCTWTYSSSYYGTLEYCYNQSDLDEQDCTDVDGVASTSKCTEYLSCEYYDSSYGETVFISGTYADELCDDFDYYGYDVIWHD